MLSTLRTHFLAVIWTFERAWPMQKKYKSNKPYCMNLIIKSTKIKTLFLTTAIFFTIVLVGTSCVYSQSPVFSGSWKLNIAKSKFEGVPEYAAVKQFDINQGKDSISIRRIYTDAQGAERVSQESISLDGNRCSKTLDDERQKTSVIKWSEDKREMITVSTYSLPSNPNQIDYKLSQTWKLNNHDKELFVVLTSSDYTIGLVYDKQ
jgi:hypothetical protein